MMPLIKPHIVLLKAGDDFDDPELQQYFISVEQKLTLECKSITAAIYYCIGVHYIIFLTILNLVMCGSLKIECKGNSKKLPSRESHFSGIDCQFAAMSGDVSDSSAEL